MDICGGLVENLLEGFIFAFIASLTWGLNSLFVRRGLRGIDLYVAVLITLLVAMPIILILTVSTDALTSIFSVTPTAALFLCLSGIFNVAVGRSLSYQGVAKVGATRSTTITSTNVFIASILGVSFLQETMTLPLAAGTLLIVTGIMIISTETHLPMDILTKRLNPSRRAFIYPILAAGAWSLVPIFAKLGLMEVKSPYLANLIATLGALVVVCIHLFSTSHRQGLRRMDKKSLGYIIIGSLLSITAVQSVYLALSILPVSQVNPVSSSYPIFTVLFAYMFMRKAENVNARLLTGVVLAVIGVIIVATIA